MSIVIPCHPSHFPLLENLLDAYASQTVLPDEVVISLSEYDKIDLALIHALERVPRPFQLILLKHGEKCSAGTNRRLAALASTGSLLICQDADDLPHPQRVEIIKYLFETHSMHLLLHSYTTMSSFPFYDKEAVAPKLLTNDLLFGGIATPNQDAIPLHHGNVSISRQVLQRAGWDGDFQGAEDMRFNMHVMKIYRRGCFAIPLQLIQFRTDLSYFSNTPAHLR